jgi:hypothetical protein
MPLPFTREQFFDLLAVYNGTLWPGAVVLWIASAVAAGALIYARRPPDRWIAAVLAAHWVWSAAAYHAALFTRINPAAWIFAALFLAEGAAFFYAGIVRGRLSFAPWRSAWAPVAWTLIAYALIYPAISAADLQSMSRAPTFGLPCPTTVFTAGLLMLATRPARGLSVVPVIWSVIGGSAAPLLGVRADIALPIAGAALAISLLQARMPRRAQSRSHV